MLLYKTVDGAFAEHEGRFFAVAEDNWDRLLNREGLLRWLLELAEQSEPLPEDFSLHENLVAPIGGHEVWAAGVTYYRSLTARTEESEKAGGSDFYDRVYHADRPELFLKATPHRVVGPGETMHLRRDSRWIVPEPELTLVINAAGKLIGYTVGNDLSCRDIEGENPLYLPQAKVYSACAGIGPGILLCEDPLPEETEIKLEINRGNASEFTGTTALDQLKKKPDSLVEYLYRDNTFPVGSFLMTGTGIVPPDDFSLQSGDEVRITITGIGTLINRME